MVVRNIRRSVSSGWIKDAIIISSLADEYSQFYKPQIDGRVPRHSLGYRVSDELRNILSHGLIN